MSSSECLSNNESSRGGEKETGNNEAPPLPGQQPMNAYGQTPFKPLAQITYHCELRLDERGNNHLESL